MALIIVGAIMIGIQLLSIMGNINMGTFDFFTNVPNLSVFIFDLISFCSFNLIGIIGLILLIIGLAKCNKNKQNCTNKNSTPAPNLHKCEMCDCDCNELTYATIKDEYGTRYRHLCDSCMKKFNATPTKK